MGEIREAEQFKVDLQKIINGFDRVALLSNDFRNIQLCSANNLAEKLIPIINDKGMAEATSFLESICEVLYFATGKTDNNIKCQFPVYMKIVLEKDKIPKVSSKGKLVYKDLPRTFGSEAVIKTVVSLKNYLKVQEELLKCFFQILVSDESYAKQLWSLGVSYINMREKECAEAFMSPIVTFQSRGSITATQGHIPELILRKYMNEWGMIAGYDYNEQDVTLGDFFGESETKDNLKKRKYDFILPYKSRDKGGKVFVQCQFYAGDSGSVSHKVVDQTDSTRIITLKKYSEAVFMEYLDGAGYYSSLNGDLRKMIAKESTYDFFQIRTASIKLRRGFQKICFLTALEIEHAIFVTGGNVADVEMLLLNDGYEKLEIQKSIHDAIANEIIELREDKLCIMESRNSIVRRYCLLDCLANFGTAIPTNHVAGNLLVPGYGVYWGMPQNNLISRILQEVPILTKEWKNIQVAFDDIQWLIDRKFVVAK
ncbi:MAG: hypothetical protein HFG49_14835 [Lachnospiraceae bacterium]|nr:hypothetical protein [Lachnospiraceae bacterium]